MCRFGHAEFDVSAASGLREAGIGTGCLVMVEQRLDAVRAVLRGAEVVEVAARVGVHRSTMQRWVVRYLTGQLGGGEPSHPPGSSLRQVACAVEFAVVEMRREHPHQLRSPASRPDAPSGCCVPGVGQCGTNGWWGERRCPPSDTDASPTVPVQGHGGRSKCGCLGRNPLEA